MSTDTPAKPKQEPPPMCEPQGFFQMLLDLAETEHISPRGITGEAMSAIRHALAAYPQPAQEPVAWEYWNPSDTTFDGPDTKHKKAVSRFTDDTRKAMQAQGWQFEPLVYAAPTQAAPAPAPIEDDQAWDRNAERITREALGDDVTRPINPHATSIDDL